MRTIALLLAVLSATPAVASDYRVVHVFVALCDNKNQGIVPVPATLGNGQDPKTNLYWGAMYGADAFFRRSPDWKVLAVPGELKPPILARAAFVSKAGPKTLVLMEAYDGASMKAALTDFLSASAGTLASAVTVELDGKRQDVAVGGAADLVCFVGHNGLMDMKLDALPQRKAGAAGPGAAVVLACKSATYFAEALKKAGCPPLITTAQLMAPEAYTLDAIIRSWAAGEAPATVLERAAAAYAKYQKIAVSAARKVFVAGPTPAR